MKRELWDGDPQCNLILPVSCPFCKKISAITIDEIVGGCGSNHIKLRYSECRTRFDHDVQKAKGDPRNIVLLGYWDGWQPFSLTGKDSLGMYTYMLALILNAVIFIHNVAT